jgi:3-oxoacyl-[acyl-carrier protein] reductase
LELGLRRKKALVTASSKGIGKAVAMELVAEGCDVGICSRSKDDLLETVREIKNKYQSDVFWSVCDLNKQKDLESTFNHFIKEFGQIDILVNNCGGPSAGYLADLDDEKWQAAFDQVLLSAVRLSRYSVIDMMKREWGRIVNITSISVKQPIGNLMLSNSLRTGLIGFAKSLSNEIGKYNITVNNIAPGYTLTNRLYELAVLRAKQLDTSHEEILIEMAKEIPLARLGGPEEIAAAVVFLASTKAGYITGTTLQVDGGLIKGLF